MQAATRFIRDNKAIVLTGGVSSAELIAMMKLGQREHVVFMVGNCPPAPPSLTLVARRRPSPKREGCSLPLLSRHTC